MFFFRLFEIFRIVSRLPLSVQQSGWEPPSLPTWCCPQQAKYHRQTSMAPCTVFSLPLTEVHLRRDVVFGYAGDLEHLPDNHFIPYFL